LSLAEVIGIVVMGGPPCGMGNFASLARLLMGSKRNPWLGLSLRQFTCHVAIGIP